MKTGFRNFLMGAGIVVMLWAPFLRAEERLAVAKVPFDLTIRLRNDSTGKSILAMPPGRDSSTRTSRPRLSFRQYEEGQARARDGARWSCGCDGLCSDGEPLVQGF